MKSLVKMTRSILGNFTGLLSWQRGIQAGMKKLRKCWITLWPVQEKHAVKLGDSCGLFALLFCSPSFQTMPACVSRTRAASTVNVEYFSTKASLTAVLSSDVFCGPGKKQAAAVSRNNSGPCLHGQHWVFKEKRAKCGMYHFGGNGAGCFLRNR